LSASRTDTKTAPPSGSAAPAPSWLFRKARAKPRSRPITSPVERISGPSSVSTPGKRAKGSTASFTATWPVSAGGSVKAESFSPAISRAAIAGDGRAHGLGDERHGARGAGIDLQHVDIAVLHGELHVHQPDHAERLRQAAVWRSSSAMVAARGSAAAAAGAVARMHAGFLDMLHDAGDVHRLAVAERVDIDFHGAGEIAVEQHRDCRPRRPPPRGYSAPAAPRRGRSPWPGRRARRRGGSPAGSRSRRRWPAPPRASARCRCAAGAG
jgi:hypothetical protein